MNVHEAIEQACAAVGIKPPRAYRQGSWAKTDTLNGRNGKGDGRVIVDDLKVVSWNWQTGEKETVWLKDRPSPAERREAAVKREKDERERKESAAAAALVAAKLVGAADHGKHPYLAKKGFADEQALILPAKAVREIAGRTDGYGRFIPADYLVPTGGQIAIVVPARIGNVIRSVQLIWEDGTKKFLFAAEMGGASHRLSTGRDTWLCEGYATGLSLRFGLRAINRADTVLCCFSASNIAVVARKIEGRCFVCADNDKPIEHFGNKGTGEHYAIESGKPYLLPPLVGQDLNDLHMAEGRFAVQRVLSAFLRTIA